MRSRLILASLILAMIFSLCACGNTDSDSDSIEKTTEEAKVESFADYSSIEKDIEDKSKEKIKKLEESFDTLLSDAYNSEEYDKVSTIWSNMYEKHSDTWSSTYKLHSNARSSLYSNHSAIWSGLYNEDTDIDTLIKK